MINNLFDSKNLHEPISIEGEDKNVLKEMQKSMFLIRKTES